jgi:excisionase family DNA binding protein
MKMVLNLDEVKKSVYRVEELAALLDRDVESVRRHIRQGRLKAYKQPGGRVYTIFGEDVIRFLKGLPPKGEAK